MSYLDDAFFHNDEPMCPNCNDEGCEFCGPDYESDYDDYDNEEDSDYDDYYDYDDRHEDDYDTPW